MTEAIVDNVVCGNCGADVREGTQFCYNCGTPIAAENVVEDQTDISPNGAQATVEGGVDEVPEETPVAADPVENGSTGKLATAAAERRRSRVRPRKKKEVVWEPVDEEPGLLFVVITLAIAVISAVIVLLTVYWK